MRPLLLALLLTLSSLTAYGQSPDCQFTQTFTATDYGVTVSNQAVANLGTQCTTWRLSYYADGMSALSIQIEGAPDASGVPGTFAAVPTTACSTTVQPPCLIDGANPLTNANHGTEAFRGYYAWIALHVTVFTPTGASGLITARMYGYKGTSSAANLLGGGGGSMTYPTTPGVAVSTGTPPTAWGTSITGLTQTLVGYIANVTSDIQAQLNSKVPLILDTGAANAYTSAAGGPTLADGLIVNLRTLHANTSASTLAYNGGGALAIADQAGSALVSGMIPVGNVLLQYQASGTTWRLLNAIKPVAAGNADTVTNGLTWLNVTVLPAAASAVAGIEYRMYAATAQNACPAAGDSGGSHVAYCQLNHAGTGYDPHLVGDASGNVSLPGDLAIGTTVLGTGGWRMLPPPSGGDDTTAIQAAINSFTSIGNSGTLVIPCGLYKITGSGAQALLIQYPISIVGFGGCSILQLQTTIGASTDAIRYAPAYATVAQGEIAGFEIFCATGNCARHGLTIDASAYSIVLNGGIHNLTIGPTGAASLYILGNAGTQSVLYKTAIHDNNIQGILGVNTGDANEIRGNVIGGNQTGLAIPAIDWTQIPGSSLDSIHDNMSLGGSFIIRAGLRTKIYHNNIEKYFADGDMSVIDLLGTSGAPIIGAEVSDNYFSTHGVTAVHCGNFDYVQQAHLAHNTCSRSSAGAEAGFIFSTHSSGNTTDPNNIFTYSSANDVQNYGTANQYLSPIVPASCNLLLQSQTIATSPWLDPSIYTVRVNNATAAPDGTTTATSALAASATSGRFGFYQGSSSITVPAGITTFSIYAKTAVNTQRVLLREGAQTGASASFDLSTGTFLVGALGGTGTILSVGNGWYRLTLSDFLAAGTTGFQVLFLPPTGTVYADVTYTPAAGDGLYAWGAQAQAGALGTYTPTTTAAACW